MNILKFWRKKNKKDNKRALSIYENFMSYFDGNYSLSKYGNTYSLGVIHLHYDENKNTLIVYLRRPGLLIGKGGVQFDELQSYLECKIKIVEVTKLWS